MQKFLANLSGLSKAFAFALNTIPNKYQHISMTNKLLETLADIAYQTGHQTMIA